MDAKTTTGSRGGYLPERLVNRFRNRVEGPYTLGNTRRFWIGFSLVLLFMLALPLFSNPFAVSNTAQLLLSVFLGLSLGVIWGYTGIFSFGQVAFYGVGGYVYGIIAINYAGSLGTITGAVVGILLAAVFSLLLGYFMFYGGVGDVFVAIITLAVTLVLQTFMAQTAGSEWRIGDALLGGANGMTGIPSIALGGLVLKDATLYYFVIFLLLAVYLGLRVLVNSNLGYVMVAIRENEERTESLGYNVKRIKLLVFTIGGALAGVSGVLYASWGNFISPNVFGLVFAAQPIIWVASGGRKWLIGAIIGTYTITYISQQLSIYGGQYAIVILGTFLLVVILLLPEGFVPRLYDRVPRLVERYRNQTGGSES